MNLLPKSFGNRPRLACEISAAGVVAARSTEPGAPLSAVARVNLAEGAVSPSLKPGNIADRVAIIAALRRTLESIGVRPNARNAELTLVIPDAAVRVLLLDFDALPNKLSEALPIVRFRLKKLVPFEADDAMISFQVMSSSRTVVRVLAVAIPRDVLTEYESLAREAGFEPGAVLPSTVAALAGLSEGEGAALVVNAHATGVTTAIVRAGILLLHRSVELAEPAPATPADLPAALFEPTGMSVGTGTMLPIVDREETAGEWAAQEALPEFGHNPYADRVSAESAVEGEDGTTGMPIPGGFPHTTGASPFQAAGLGSGSHGSVSAREPVPVSRSPYADPTALADLDAARHNAILGAPTSLGTLTDPLMLNEFHQLGTIDHHGVSDHGDGPGAPVHTLGPDAQAEEIANAISVAVAYFEDSLGAAPEILLAAGPVGADLLSRTLREQGVAQADGLRVRELVEPAALAAGTVTQNVPRGWLAGVVGALKS
ncbi:MAG: hypothetical protein ACRYFU_09620 [Janthinobacterium lividum]